MLVTDPKDAALRRRLAAPLGGKAGSEHPDPGMIVAHAAHELSPEFGLAITRHLAVCDDGRCTAILRDAIAGAAVARDALYGRLDAGQDEGQPPGLSEGPPPEAPETATAPPPGPEAATAPPPPMGVHGRTFECLDDLWEAFIAIAEQSGRTMDELLDEAMAAFAQERTGGHPHTPGQAGVDPPAAGPAFPFAAPLMMPRDVAVMEAPHGSFPHAPPRERNTPTLPRAYLPRTPASSMRASPPPSPSADHLSVILEGVRYEVTKERFVVGRGGRASDLAIDDPGVSRQHAVIERAGGAYYLVDMGSTNGVEYEGERIARKEIAHGDRFRIGGHELEFLFT